MRIFIIHNFYQHAGGEDSVFKQEVDELSQEHQVATFTCQNQKGIAGIAQFLSYPFNIRMARQVMHRIASFKPDVVHIHNLHYALGPWLIRKLAAQKIPVVMTLHNYRLLCPSATLFFRGQLFTSSLQADFPWQAVRKRVLDNSLLKTAITGFTYWWHRKLGTWHKVDQFIVLSDFAKQIFEESSFPVAADYFTVRPNAVDVLAGKANRTQDFLYIGRLSEEKGILPLLLAVAETDFRIKVFGTGPQQEQVEALAGKHSNIQYMGFHNAERLAQELATATALVVPSLCYEGMPMSILEAFGNETAVLASNIGILAEMIVPLRTGLSFDPYNKEEIKAALLQWSLMDTPSKVQIGKNCRAEYENKYTVKQNMLKLLAIYQGVQLNKRNR